MPTLSKSSDVIWLVLIGVATVQGVPLPVTAQFEKTAISSSFPGWPGSDPKRTPFSVRSSAHSTLMPASGISSVKPTTASARAAKLCVLPATSLLPPIDQNGALTACADDVAVAPSASATSSATVINRTLFIFTTCSHLVTERQATNGRMAVLGSGSSMACRPPMFVEVLSISPSGAAATSATGSRHVLETPPAGKRWMLGYGCRERGARQKRLRC